MEYFLNLLAIAGIFPLLIGILTVGTWALPVKQPADTSNRINRIRLWWYAISAPHRFVGNFNWLKGDESDNLNDNTWDK